MLAVEDQDVAAAMTYIRDHALEGCTVQDVLRPVSYTHLRAHETVLDLVCRLLLEKKNNLESYVMWSDH